MLVCISHGFSKDIREETDILKYKKMGLVWGLLKYHHPDISKGKYNWDGKFIKLFGKIKEIDNEDKTDSTLLAFVNQFDRKNLVIRDEAIDSDVFIETDNYQWIDSVISNQDLKNALIQISKNRKIGEYYAKVTNLGFISFPNENKFENFEVLDDSQRLLLFFEIWNAIEYWDVNKRFSRNDWYSILDEYIIGFLDCSSTLEFELLKSKLISELSDSHSYYFPKIITDNIFRYKPNFGVIYINDSLVVNYIYNETICKENDIKLGDVIIEVDGTSVRDNLINKLSNSISASNFNFLAKFSYY